MPQVPTNGCMQPMKTSGYRNWILGPCLSPWQESFFSERNNASANCRNLERPHQKGSKNTQKHSTKNEFSCLLAQRLNKIQYNTILLQAVPELLTYCGWVGDYLLQRIGHAPEELKLSSCCSSVSFTRIEDRKLSQVQQRTNGAFCNLNDWQVALKATTHQPGEMVDRLQLTHPLLLHPLAS